jgi:GNAT superfamily N-acetyltransferase
MVGVAGRVRTGYGTASSPGTPAPGMIPGLCKGHVRRRRRELLDADISPASVAKSYRLLKVTERAAGEAGPGTPPGCYLSGVLVEQPAWRGRGIATALSQARLRWVFACTDEASYVAGADNTASLRLHAALGLQEMTSCADAVLFRPRLG